MPENKTASFQPGDITVDKQNKTSVIKSGNDKDGYTVVQDGKDTQKQAADLTLVREAMDWSHIALEVTGNALHHGILQKIQKRGWFGPRTRAFAISDVVYETLGKSFFEPWFSDLIGMEAPRYAEDSFVQAADFKDALKAVPIALIQALVQKVMYKQGLSSNLVRNAVEAYIAIAVANIDVRMIRGWTSGAKKSVRRY